jgi:hypothetical protein
MNSSNWYGLLSAVVYAIPVMVILFFALDLNGAFNNKDGQ